MTPPAAAAARVASLRISTIYYIEMTNIVDGAIVIYSY